jgi:hypothetical protein
LNIVYMYLRNIYRYFTPFSVYFEVAGNSLS